MLLQVGKPHDRGLADDEAQDAVTAGEGADPVAVLG